jgi:peptide/nickel transport system permease protein
MRALGQWQRLAAALLGSSLILSLTGPWWLPYSPYAVDFLHIAEGPDGTHWLGTDELGRDVASRVVHGARVSLLIAGAVQIGATCLGLCVGLAAGYARPRADAVVMAIVDMAYGFPPLLIVLVIAALLPPGVWSIVLAFTLVSWPQPARLMRGQVLSLRNREFVLAAVALGAPAPRILFRHVLLNSADVLVVHFTQAFATVVMGEAALSYLGLGIPASQPSWGMMIAKGREYFLSAPHILLAPMLALMVTVVSLNALGDSLTALLERRVKAWPI